ncbi:MAG: sigma-54-dependent Fis family transcriptional regulator [Gammaproteobacteria bacterium]|nr:sigma-54-dependent Fis family transcriptional regulator [Gammaproteobacteria bacterium]
MNNNHVLIVEDDEELRQALADTLEPHYTVHCVGNGAAALASIAESRPAVILSDVQMQPVDGYELLKKIRQQGLEIPVILMTAYATVERAVNALHAGANDYLVKPFNSADLLDVLAKYTENTVVASFANNEIAVDAASQKTFELAKKVARSDIAVMIAGESGTGKEVLARHIHAASTRAAGAFVAINCAAIPENMLEAVLFGYEKGAFTGAIARTPGKFEQAQDGTLLLDEISEMDLNLQAKLLRVLQEREVERLGGRELIKLNVRVLATTNRDLKLAVAQGTFREDLYYRLNVFPLTTVPLRARKNDIIPLAEYFIRRYAYSNLPLLSPLAKHELMQYAWPGNVRELENAVQRALVVCNGDMIEALDFQLDSDVESTDAMVHAQEPADASLSLLNKKHESEVILEALQAGSGSRKLAAERLGISPRTLRYKLSRMREMGILIPA